jgi:hypothetical protein
LAVLYIMDRIIHSGSSDFFNIVFIILGFGFTP